MVMIFRQNVNRFHSKRFPIYTYAYAASCECLRFHVFLSWQCTAQYWCIEMERVAILPIAFLVFYTPSAEGRLAAISPCLPVSLRNRIMLAVRVWTRCASRTPYNFHIVHDSRVTMPPATSKLSAFDGDYYCHWDAQPASAISIIIHTIPSIYSTKYISISI